MPFCTRARAVGVCAALLALPLLLPPGLLARQTGTVTGRVFDAGSGEPVSAVQVHIPDLEIGALTGPDGRYSIVNVPAGTHTLAALRLGFRQAIEEAVTVRAGETTVIDFRLASTALVLDEVIVTGTPGGTRRRAIGNAVTRLDVSDVSATRPVRSIQDVLQGRSPGVTFTRTSGNVGEGATIRIRGVSSFGLGTQPLIYVDGIRMDNNARLGPRVPNLIQSGSISALDDLSPADIESIEIIKGPAAATLYGTEASAGVIQIITKRGQAGSPRFDMQVSQGSNFLMNPEGLIGDQYRCPALPPCSEDEVIRFNMLELERANGNSPLQHGHTQRYSLNVRGGTDLVNYFLSGDVADMEGAVHFNWNKRASGRANLGVILSPQLSLDLSTGYVSGRTRLASGLPEAGSVWSHLMWAHGREELPGRGYLLQYTPENIATVESIRDFSRFTGSIRLSHNPASWLEQRLIVGLDRGEEESYTLFPRHEAGTAGPFGQQSLGEVEVYRPITNEQTVDYAASARYRYNDAISLVSSIGFQYYSRELNRIATIGRVFPVPAIRSIEGATSTGATQTFLQNKSVGVYFQQELGWNDRLFFTAAVRGDDNSAFGANFDAAIYPKFSGTWVVSEEPFWNIDAINSLRLRSAWGQAGRQPSTFAAVTLLQPTAGSGGVPAITPATVGNPDVGPEVGTELELGFEMSALNDRLAADFTYFHQRITDALVSVPLPPSHGFPGNQAANLGRLDNWGYEVGLNARPVERSNWSLDMRFSLSYTMNEIKDLGGRSPTGSLRHGFPWPNRTSTIIESGEFNEAGQPANLMCDAGISLAPSEELQGSYGWKRGGEIVPCAETIGRSLLLGPTFSPWLWSMDANLSVFRNLQIFGLVDAEHGSWLNDYNVSCRHPTCGFANSRLSMTRSDPIYVESAIFFGRFPVDQRQYISHDGSYIRLREVGMRYQLPEVLARNMRADRATLSLSARNLWYLWQKQKYMGGERLPSPEMSDPTSETGFALFQWPPLTSFEASLRVSF